jgi:hypothetical protein
MIYGVKAFGYCFLFKLFKKLRKATRALLETVTESIFFYFRHQQDEKLRRRESFFYIIMHSENFLTRNGRTERNSYGTKSIDGKQVRGRQG